jgi:hypothetical protein
MTIDRTAGLADTVDRARLEVADVGYAVVELDSSENALRELVNLVCRPRGGTFWSEIQDVVYQPGTDPRVSVAASDRVLRPHSDGSFEPNPPHMLFLQCVRPDLPGYGESRVVRAETIVATLPSAITNVLRQPQFRFFRRSDGKTSRVVASIIGTGTDGSPTIRFRHDEKYRIAAETPQGASALEELCAVVVDDAVQEAVPLRQGAVLWLDNRRNLHARTALSGQVLRRLRTAWGDAVE